MDTDKIDRLVNDLKLSNDAKKWDVTITSLKAAQGKKRIEQVIVRKTFAKNIVNHETLRVNLPKVLRSREGVELEVVGHNIFVVSFSLAADKITALEKWPWHYFYDLLIIKKTDTMQTPMEVNFNEVALWVKCHNVPLACMEPRIIRRVWEKVGWLEDVDIGERELCVGKL